MAAKKNEVAILLATYNGEKYIEEQLQSLVDQTYERFICYIHDDGSKDRTVDIIKRFQEIYPERFKLLDYQGGHGAIGNFVSLAKYVREYTDEPYIMFADQDDYWYPAKVEKELRALKNEEDSTRPYLVYCDQEIVNAELNIIAESGMAYSKRVAGIDDSFKELVFENCAPGCTIGINRACLNIAVDNLTEEHIVMHDWWFMLIARCYGDILYINEPLMKYRQHGNNTLGADNKSLIRKILKYLGGLKYSINAKAQHVKKCETQINDISKMEKCLYDDEVKMIEKVLSKNRLSRIIFFYSNNYIKTREFFSLLFV